MAKPSKAVLEFMERYQIQSDEIWEVHGSTWVVKHKALERVASEVGIVWEKPELKVCDMEKGLIAILVGGRLGGSAGTSRRRRAAAHRIAEGTVDARVPQSSARMEIRIGPDRGLPAMRERPCVALVVSRKRWMDSMSVTVPPNRAMRI